ncbi:MAG: FAD-binding oxidoreductase [Pirellulales bacterium]|nr:FAD-binding oxidoreductase [Pirellulales bacterium]
MSVATDALPLASTATPSTVDELAEIVREAHGTETPVYPLGGKTALRYGLPARRSGIGLELAGLTRVIDYPARDMTITVEAGITMRALAETMAAERQRLPIDAPQAEHATLGGMLATNWSGALRYGHGTLRDYVIGISAVDGRGTAFKGGGRVVKNVAGYDFCKLLTGSLGTLAVITQVTLKVKPIPAAMGYIACDVPSFAQAETMLARLVHSQTAPVSVELLAGEPWKNDPALGPLRSGSIARLVVGVEGTEVEVDWMLDQLAAEWHDQGVRDLAHVERSAVAGFAQRLVEFPTDGESALVLKAHMVPSATTKFCEALLAALPGVDVQAHAGNGAVVARWRKMPENAARAVIGRLQPVAGAGRGNIEVLSYADGIELTRQVIWGGTRSDYRLMQSVKQAFDPKDILNPGRFVFPTT